MSTKSPECWANDPQAHGVRVEISADHSMLLPHDEFAFAELKGEGKEQELRLVFAMHEVLVRGHSLRRIETAMQRSELSLLTALSGKQRSLIPDGQPLVPITALQRYGNTDEIASFVAYLASPEASYITGANLLADGGFAA